MTTTPLTAQSFREGDEVILVLGTYPGTPGRFLRFRDDTNWADITERNGRVRSHPVAWLSHNPAVLTAPIHPVDAGTPSLGENK
jgi:hypothetical protein